MNTSCIAIRSCKSHMLMKLQAYKKHGISTVNIPSTAQCPPISCPSYPVHSISKNRNAAEMRREK